MKNRFLILVAIIFALSIFNSFSGEAETHNLQLSGKSFIPAQARLKEALSPNEMISGTIYFRLRDEANLDLLLAKQQDPSDANYHTWLSPREFGEKFGASESTYQKAITWLEQSGLKVNQTWTNHLRLDFQAPASEIEKVFQVQMQLFELENKTYYGHLQQPYIPTSLVSEVLDVKLHNFLFTQPTIKRQEKLADFVDRGRFAVGPQDLYIAYNFKPIFANGIEGNGQTIGIIARSDFNMSDVEDFRNLFKLPTNNVVKVPAGGQIIDRGGIETLEVLLDTQVSSATAPKATVQVAIADKDNDVDQSLAYFLDKLPDTKVLSISFGECEKFLFPQFEALFNNLYKQAAAQGQSVVVSSGDQGANDCGDGQIAQVNALAASPFVTAVGGTSLKLGFDDNGNATSYQGEQVWSGSGGGISLFFPRPDYQTTAGITEIGRTVPDVALLADPSRPGFFIVQDSSTRVIGGTSASAPVWAGILALTNQASQTNGLGNANYRIYQLGKMQQMAASPLPGFFNDITEGNNASATLPGYKASFGYDLCTGWGTPNVNRFVMSFGPNPEQQKALFLLFPNGGEFLPKDEKITVRWNVLDSLATKITSQDLLVSMDEGATFKPIATNLAPTVRSFDFTTSKATARARFRIITHTSSSTDIVDTSDATLNIGTDLNIDFARYSILDNRLEIEGGGFSKKVKLFVNGSLIDRQAKLVDGKLLFKGKQKKLKLKAGENTIILEVDSVSSATYKLYL